MYEPYVSPASELYHFGILGMKWGVRRYQNPDGTLTEAGKKRYGYKSLQTKKYEWHGDTSSDQYRRSVELDNKLADRYSNYTEKSDFVKQLLIGNNLNTYEMARATGHSKLGSWLRANFDTNIAHLIGESTIREATLFANKYENQSAKDTLNYLTSLADLSLAYYRPEMEATWQQRSMRDKYIARGSKEEQKAREKEEKRLAKSK